MAFKKKNYTVSTKNNEKMWIKVSKYKNLFWWSKEDLVQKSTLQWLRL